MSCVENRIINGQSVQTRSRILVLGPASHGIAGALLRLETHAEILAVEKLNEALELLGQENFDHVLVDNRQDGTMTLAIPALARLRNVAKITVLAGPKSSREIAAVPGIGHVVHQPYNPVEIANSLGIEITDSRKNTSGDENQQRREDDIQPALMQSRPANPVIPDEPESGDAERSAILEMFATLGNLVPALTPIISAIYKNLALVILAALFAAFVMYGIMIAFFLTSSDWSSPLQLQRGHELVIKAARERGELQVKRNLIKQQLSDARNKANRGRRSLERANELSRIAEVTIDQEMQNRDARYALIKNEIKALKNVIASYGPAEERAREKATLNRDYSRRVITRHIYQRNLLNLAEIGKNLAALNEQVSRKQTEMMLNRQAHSYLAQLKSRLLREDGGIQLIGGKAEFVPIANQIIEVKQIRSTGKADIDEFEATSRTLENSRMVLSQSILELEATPMISALKAPVNVLFVPYDNADNYQKGEPLYTCAIAVFWCSQVGTVGAPINGEIVTTHPFFGKPIRGQFVQANLTETSAAQKEIIHVGRPPFFF